MNKNPRLKKMWFSTMGVLLTVVFMMSGYSTKAAAAVVSLDEIRVALFISEIDTVPAVTFQSNGTIQLGIRTSEGTEQWTTISDAFRLSAEQWMIKALETTDSAKAASAKEIIQGQVPEAFIFTDTRDGKKIYSVYGGSYPSVQAAQTALDDLSSASQSIGSTFTIVGPEHASVGSFDTKQEAEQKRSELQDAGVEAFIALHETDAENIVYSVLIGEGADENELESSKSVALNKLPDLTIQNWDESQPYYIIRKTVTSEEGEIEHYFFNRDNQKAWLESTDDSISVKEKYYRTYRGSMEVSVYEQQLAVVNQLPLEEYLYSVVGTEMSGNWPIEALKAQAVAARTFALFQGVKYQIAHISDTTNDQAYHGITSETSQTIAAVESTKGQVIVDQNGQLIEPLYSSNAGGMTADPSEVWGGDVSYLNSVPSPDNEPEEGVLDWHRVVLADGTVGYIRSDLLTDTGRKNAAGFPIYTPNGTNINVRPAPYVPYIQNENEPITQVDAGQELIVFETRKESNVYEWVRGPLSAEEVLSIVNARLSEPISGPLTSLLVTERGPSGRVMQIQANGKVIDVEYPDQFRSIFNGLLSTRFDIEQSDSYTVIGKNGQQNEVNGNNSQMYVIDASGQTSSLQTEYFFAANEYLDVRVLTKEPHFRFLGYGYGHGLGMSQYGAKELAEFMGYDYEQILKYYYTNIDIVKE